MKAILKIYYNLPNEKEEVNEEIIEYNTDAEVEEYCRRSEIEFTEAGYGGHFSWIKFDEEDIIDVRGILNVNINWDDVFDSQRFFPFDYYQCIEMAKRTKKYLAFNGLVYSVDDIEMKNKICTIEELDGNR